MRVIGVLDLKGGVVVRGVAGRRHEYRPVVSRLCGSAAPVEVAGALQRHLGLAELYLADLDAIAGVEPAWQVYRDVRALGVRLWVDAGVRTAQQGLELAQAGVDSVVVGLETVAGLGVLGQLASALGERLVFSLDLKDGEPLGDHSGWAMRDAEGIVAEAVGGGVRRVLVLDLARVGVGEGTGTEKLCAALARAHPQLEITAGGGVRGREDLLRLRQCGASAVLVASALHDGRLSKADLAAL